MSQLGDTPPTDNHTHSPLGKLKPCQTRQWMELTLIHTIATNRERHATESEVLTRFDALLLENANADKLTAMTLTKVVFPEFCRPTRVSSISSFQKRLLNHSTIRLKKANILSLVDHRLQARPLAVRGFVAETGLKFKYILALHS